MMKHVCVAARIGEGKAPIATCMAPAALMRKVVFLTSWLACGAAAAAMTCEQLGNIAQTTEKLRNEGASLPSILAEADKLEVSDKLTKEDLGRVREVIDATFKRNYTPLEILQDCKDSQPSRWRWWSDKQKGAK